MPAPTCKAQTTAQHLQPILDHYPDVPILLLWDRAPWHSGAPIRELLAANPRLELLLLPTAAPDLNPQEHVWKAVRYAVSHNHTTVRLADLATQWLDFLRSHRFPCSLLENLDFFRLRNLSTAFT
jgi:transposase